jgi:hypothetical protein
MIDYYDSLGNEGIQKRRWEVKFDTLIARAY